MLPGLAGIAGFGSSTDSADAAIAALNLTAWWDPSDLSTMFTDAAGTTQAVVGNSIARINDKSGNGNHLINSTGSNLPLLQQDGSGHNYLLFSNAGTWIDCTGISMSQANDFCLGIYFNDVTTFRVVYHGITTVQYMVTQSGTPRIYGGTAAVAAGTVSASTLTVLTARYDGAASFIRKNGTSTTVASTIGTGGLLGLRVGATPANASFLSARLYGMVCRDATFSAGELTTIEAYEGAKMGI